MDSQKLSALGDLSLTSGRIETELGDGEDASSGVNMSIRVELEGVVADSAMERKYKRLDSEKNPTDFKELYLFLLRVPPRAKIQFQKHMEKLDSAGMPLRKIFLYKKPLQLPAFKVSNSPLNNRCSL